MTDNTLGEVEHANGDWENIEQGTHLICKDGTVRLGDGDEIDVEDVGGGASCESETPAIYPSNGLYSVPLDQIQNINIAGILRETPFMEKPNLTIMGTVTCASGLVRDGVLHAKESFGPERGMVGALMEWAGNMNAKCGGQGPVRNNAITDRSNIPPVPYSGR